MLLLQESEDWREYVLVGTGQKPVVDVARGRGGRHTGVALGRGTRHCRREHSSVADLARVVRPAAREHADATGTADFLLVEHRAVLRL